MSRQLDWTWIRKCLAARREARDLEEQGYRKHETDWEIIRGGRWDEVILDVRISADRKHVWTKIGKPDGESNDRKHVCKK